MQKIETIDQPRGEAAAVGQFDMFRRRVPDQISSGQQFNVVRSFLREADRRMQEKGNLVAWINGLRVLMEAGQ